MMDGIEIHAAAPADVVKLLPLIEAYWRHDGIAGFDSARLRSQLDEFLAQPAYGRGWLAMQAGAALGYLLCTFVYSFEHGGLMAEIDEFYVEGRYRGRGVGQALLARARAQLAAHGCRWLQLQVADGNSAAQDFYARLGFREKSGYRLWVAPLA